ncbi:MAG TPA: G5 domain-containing protein, partial [Bacillales bacterium]|nr:G5 domain-containing protein [Bacillales bacterium]
MSVGKLLLPLAGFCLLSVLLVFSVGGERVSAEGLKHIKWVQTVYHVFVDGTQIGVVRNKGEVEQLITGEVAKAELGHPGLQYTIQEDVTFKADKAFRPKVDESRTIDSLKDKLTLKVEAYQFRIGDKTIGYVHSKEEAHEIIRRFESAYIPRKVLKKSKNAGPARVDAGDHTSILNVSLSKDVSLKAAKVNPEQLITVDEGVQSLTKNTRKKKIYTVKEGDMLGSIADQFGLSEEALKKLNGSLNEDGILHVGENLVVTAPKPFVKVVVKKAVVKRENIPFETKTKEDDSMYKGESKVKQKGKTGKKRVR